MLLTHNFISDGLGIPNVQVRANWLIKCAITTHGKHKTREACENSSHLLHKHVIRLARQPEKLSTLKNAKVIRGHKNYYKDMCGAGKAAWFDKPLSQGNRCDSNIGTHVLVGRTKPDATPTDPP